MLAKQLVVAVASTHCCTACMLHVHPNLAQVVRRQRGGDGSRALLLGQHSGGSSSYGISRQQKELKKHQLKKQQQHEEQL